MTVARKAALSQSSLWAHRAGAPESGQRATVRIAPAAPRRPGAAARASATAFITDPTSAARAPLNPTGRPPWATLQRRYISSNQRGVQAGKSGRSTKAESASSPPALLGASATVTSSSFSVSTEEPTAVTTPADIAFASESVPRSADRGAVRPAGSWVNSGTSRAARAASPWAYSGAANARWKSSASSRWPSRRTRAAAERRAASAARRRRLVGSASA
ncbi:hypothetical protein [Azospirillum largimobile]